MTEGAAGPSGTGNGDDRDDGNDKGHGDGDGDGGYGGEPVVGDGRERPRGRWTNRVGFAAWPGGTVFAYRPGEILTLRGEDALATTRERNNDVRVLQELGQFTRLGGIADVLAEVGELRRRGILAQPNHVFFAHDGVGPTPVFPTPVFPTPVFPTGANWGCRCCSPGPSCPPHPSKSCACGGVFPTPVFPTPVFPTPVFPTPVFPTPVFPTPVFPTEMKSTARAVPPATDVSTATAALAAPIPSDGPLVIVLDTGLAADGPYFPAALTSAPVAGATSADHDEPDEDGDGGLDPCAGHGTFIAGVVGQVAPGCEVVIHRVFSTFADSSEAEIVDAIANLDPARPDRTILNLSFGGYTLDLPVAMAMAIAAIQATGVVVVASAGNDATCVPTYPAAFPGVVAVGAVGPTGPAPFTNYGPWVRACAPGVDIVSTFFQGFNGSEPVPPGGGGDPDDFSGWARWSGTSFSAPVVAGALARRILTDGCTAEEAVSRVVDAPALMRIPNLGTVVNVI